MRRLHSTGQDSLELLLDTLCNVFGGIILITCLLALMGQSKRPLDDLESKDKAGQGMLTEMRLAAAQAELERLSQLESRLSKQDDASLNMLAAERDELEKTLARLREQKANQATSQTAVVAPLDPGQEVSKLKQKTDQARTELTQAHSESAAIQARTAELKSRIEAIQAKISQSEEARTQKFRFPKEGTHTRRAWYVLIQNGEIYTPWLPDGTLSPGVKEEVQSDKSQRISPIPGKGMRLGLDTTTIKSLLQEIGKEGMYVSIVVYEDGASFETFRQLKELILSQPLEYGFSLQPKDTPISFSASGSSAPPL